MPCAQPGLRLRRKDIDCQRRVVRCCPRPPPAALITGQAHTSRRHRQTFTRTLPRARITTEPRCAAQVPLRRSNCATVRQPPSRSRALNPRTAESAFDRARSVSSLHRPALTFLYQSVHAAAVGRYIGFRETFLRYRHNIDPYGTILSNFDHSICYS